jgi:hypothetical protein
MPQMAICTVCGKEKSVPKTVNLVSLHAIPAITLPIIIILIIGRLVSFVQSCVTFQFEQLRESLFVLLAIELK